MANEITKLPPTMGTLIDPVDQLRDNYLGLSILLANVPEKSSSKQNTSEAINAMKNHMVVAKKLTYDEIYRVAAVPNGISKFASSSSRLDVYRHDASVSIETPNNVPWVLSRDGYCHLLIFNESVNNCDHLYNSIDFSQGLPSRKGNGFHTTAGGWGYLTIGKMFEGVNDLTDDKWMSVRHWTDEHKVHKQLNSINEKSQAKLICGSGNEKKDGTCCLYYQDNYYDSVTGLTGSAGDYFKCICAKCYHCINVAKSMNMDYAFTAFAGASGPTEEERCQDCNLDDFPTSCGVCSCRIDKYEKTDDLINDIHLPEKGIAKENARIAQDCKSKEGSLFLHVNLTSLSYENRKVARKYWGKLKELTVDGPQISSEKSVYALVTETNGNEEFVTGIRIKTIGRYYSMPDFPADKLADMLPGMNPSNFRMVHLPNFEQIAELARVLGGTKAQIRSSIPIEDISKITSVSKFNRWCVGVPKTGTGVSFFANSNNIPTVSRLTYKNDNIAKSSGQAYLSLNNFENDNDKKSTKTYTNTSNGKYATIANVETFSETSVGFEVCVGNSDISIIKDFSIKDEYGNIFDTNGDWSIPISPDTKEVISPMTTDILHVSNFSLSIPNKKKTDANIGLTTSTLNITVTFGSA